MLRSRDLLTVAQVSERSGFAPSALRYYERLGLWPQRERVEVSVATSAMCCGAWRSFGPPATSG
jgi:hypothetical protein